MIRVRLLTLAGGLALTALTVAAQGGPTNRWRAPG